MKKEIVVKRVSREIMSKRAAKHQEQTYWGEEPIWNPLWSEAEVKDEMGHALNWYNAMTDPDKQKGFLVSYIKAHPGDFFDVDGLVNQVERGDENSCTTYGSIARMSLNGWIIPAKYIKDLRDRIEKIAGDVLIKEANIQPVPKVIKPRDARVNEGISLVDELIDDYAILNTARFPSESLADSVLEMGLTDIQRRKVQEHYSRMVEELTELQVAISVPKEERDAIQLDLISAYRGYTKQTIERLIAWLTGEPTEEALAAAPVKERKPRKKKVKTTAQILKHFTFMESFEEGDVRLQSIDADKIIGATTLWIYNTVKRRLGVFRAKEGGLDILRRSVTNYDEDTSIWKKVRKPEEVLPRFQAAGKVELRKFMDSIRATEGPIGHRLNEDTILLKVQ